jgi:hypothetical protein
MHWTCALDDPSSLDHLIITGLIDNGCHAVLICLDLVELLALRTHKLHTPMAVDVALSPSSNDHLPITFTDWVKLKPHDTNNNWSSRTVRAIVAPGLCAPIIFGLPFLSTNNIVIDHDDRTCIDEKNGFDLLNPAAPCINKHSIPAQQHNREMLKRAKLAKKAVIAELKLINVQLRREIADKCEPVKPFDVISAVRVCIESLAAQAKLDTLANNVHSEFKDVFEPLPHVSKLSPDILCKIQLKNADSNIATRSYSCPRKYREAWKTLIQQHLDAGHI